MDKHLESLQEKLDTLMEKVDTMKKSNISIDDKLLQEFTQFHRSLSYFGYITETNELGKEIVKRYVQKEAPRYLTAGEKEIIEAALDAITDYQNAYDLLASPRGGYFVPGDFTDQDEMMKLQAFYTLIKKLGYCPESNGMPLNEA